MQQPRVNRFVGRNSGLVYKMNLLRDAANRTRGLTGDGLVASHTSETGTTHRLSMGQLLPRIPKVAATGSPIHLAYCKVAAPADDEITCFLDTDTTGDEITVKCSIAGGGNLEDAIPRLTDGLAILVTQIGADYWCLTVFQASEDCTCTAP